MPVVIYQSKDGNVGREVGCLCDESWELARQMYALEEWLKTEGIKLPKGEYVADVGICARTDFAEGVGGGAAFPPEAMGIMVEKGISLLISEYPPTTSNRDWSTFVAGLGVDMLIDHGIMKRADFERATSIVAEEIGVRLAMGDYPSLEANDEQRE